MMMVQRYGLVLTWQTILVNFFPGNKDKEDGLFGLIAANPLMFFNLKFKTAPKSFNGALITPTTNFGTSLEKMKSSRIILITMDLSLHPTIS